MHAGLETNDFFTYRHFNIHWTLDNCPDEVFNKENLKQGFTQAI